MLAALAAWLVAGGLLLLLVGYPPVQRTQEARVLETAREMLENGAWLNPTVNGEPRLQKPPLCYWMAAGSFAALGVSAESGRLPTILCAWLTVGIVGWLGRRWWNAAAGYVAAATLLGSYLFFRHGRLAETDAPAALFVTLAMAGFWWALSRSPDGTVSARSNLGFNLAMVAIGAAALAKGGPAVFAPLFFFLLVVVEKRWEALKRFISSWAWMTGIAALLPVAFYFFQMRRAGVFDREMDALLQGRDHGSPPWDYLHLWLLALLPFSAIWVLAAVRAIGLWKIDTAARRLLLWHCAILLPLLLTGNKQIHYLVPMMPPAALLMAWMTQTELATNWKKLLRRVMTISLLSVAGFAVVLGVLALRRPGGGWMWPDAILLAILTATALIGLYVQRQRTWSASLLALAIGWATAAPLLQGWFFPSLEPQNVRWTAGQLTAQYGLGPYCFYGKQASLPLCFALRQTIPIVETAEELARRRAADEHLTALLLTAPQAPQAHLPEPWRYRGRMGPKGHHVQIFEVPQP